MLRSSHEQFGANYEHTPGSYSLLYNCILFSIGSMFRRCIRPCIKIQKSIKGGNTTQLPSFVYLYVNPDDGWGPKHVAY